MGLKRTIKNIYAKYKIYKMQKRYQSILEKVKKRKKKKVVFLIAFIQEWNKFQNIYFEFMKHREFEVKVFVCPTINLGIDYCVEEYTRALEYFQNNDIETNPVFLNGDIRDISDANLLDIKSAEEPDIVFHNVQYEGQVPQKYFVTHFNESLNCYVPYAFFNAVDRWWFDVYAQNLMWKIFGETRIHKELAEQKQRIRGVNWVVSGYTGIDEFLYEHKFINKNNKLIIFAPHHNKIKNFIMIAEDMIKLTSEFSNIDFVFKPHPMLKSKLYENKYWRKSKTDEYFELWNNKGNRMLAEGEYVELFHQSDAMIHDCGSFSAEYLSTGKPVLYMISEESLKEELNDCGREVYNLHYHSRNSRDIYDFIEDVVLKGNDYKKLDRVKFINTILKPNGNIPAYKFIVDYIINETKN